MAGSIRFVHRHQQVWKRLQAKLKAPPNPSSANRKIHEATIPSGVLILKIGAAFNLSLYLNTSDPLIVENIRNESAQNKRNKHNGWGFASVSLQLFAAF